MLPSPLPSWSQLLSALALSVFLQHNSQNDHVENHTNDVSRHLARLMKTERRREPSLGTEEGASLQILQHHLGDRGVMDNFMARL